MAPQATYKQDDNHLPLPQFPRMEIMDSVAFSQGKDGWPTSEWWPGHGLEGRASSRYGEDSLWHLQVLTKCCKRK